MSDNEELLGHLQAHLDELSASTAVPPFKWHDATRDRFDDWADELLTTVIRSKAPKFTPAQIDAAVAQAKALPGRKSDPNKIKAKEFWSKPDHMPGIDDVDFRDINVTSTDLASLYRSNRSLDRDRLVWHCQNPGQARNKSPFTQNPMVLNTPDGMVIIDGHHRLAALMLLGQTSWPCWQLPSK